MTLVHNDDLICIKNCVDPLRHDDDGTIAHFLFQSLSQHLIRLEVQRREAVVEQINSRFFHQRPCNGKPLFLSAGHIGSALRNFLVQTIFFRLDKFHCLRCFRSFDHLVVRRIFLAVL